MKLASGMTQVRMDIVLDDALEVRPGQEVADWQSVQPLCGVLALASIPPGGWGTDTSPG